MVDRGDGNLYYVANERTDVAESDLKFIKDVFYSRRWGVRDQIRLLRRALPTEEELQFAMGLFLLRTGFNLTTARNINPDKWHRPHPIHGISGSYVDIFSVKKRPARRFQYFQSSANKEFSAFDIMRRVLAWTQPLREIVMHQIRHIEHISSSNSLGLSASARMDLRQELPHLKRLKACSWLVMREDGTIAEPEFRWSGLNAKLSDLGLLRSNGKRFELSQSMARRAWAIFVYDKSGSNLILTKLALGHSDLRTLITYISSRKREDSQRASWLSLNEALLHQFQSGASTAPEIIRELVGGGRVTKDEAKRLRDPAALTGKGLQCLNPFKPDPHIEPNHRPGDTCVIQDCYNGCSRAFPTFDTAIHVARQISRLEQQKEKMDVLSWCASSYPEQLMAAERLLNKYSPKAQKEALDIVKSRPPRPIFGMMSGEIHRKLSD